MTRVSGALRRLIIERAHNCCEYCRLSQHDDEFSFHIDHIIAEKHGGESISDNLCLSCYICNAHKGSDISSIDRQTGDVITLFNPRTQKWSDHFQMVGSRIEPQTSVGRVTARLLQFNLPERVSERETLMQLGRYPCSG